MISLSAKTVPQIKIASRFWIVLFGLTVFLRVSALYTPFFDVDEAQFAGFAHVLMDGGLPFRDSLDTKSLGIYLFYWACFAIFGQYNMIAVHAVTIVWSFLAAFSLYQLFRVFERESEGKLAALLYTIFSASYVPKYIATSINSVMVLFLVLSLLFLLLAERHKKIAFDFLAGLMVGIAFVFKYQAGIQIVVYFLFTLPLWEFRHRDISFVQPSWKKFFLRNLIFGAAFLLPFALQAFVLLSLGVWKDFYEWSLLGSGRYIVAGQQTILFWQNFLQRFCPYVLATLVLWYGVFLGLKERVWQGQRGLSFLLFLSWLFALIPVCMGGRFYPHYFLQMLPVLSALAALELYPVLLSQARVRMIVIIFCLFVTAVFWLLRADYEVYLNHFGDDDLYQQKRIGEKIRAMTDSQDHIFIWGFANVIHFYSERPASSRFLWSDWLTGRVPGPDTGRSQEGQSKRLVSDFAWQKLFEDFSRRSPAIFVDTSTAGIHGYEKYPISNYPELYRYVLENFPRRMIVEGVSIYTK